MEIKKELLYKLKELFPEDVLEVVEDEKNLMPYVRVRPEKVLDIMLAIKNNKDFQCDYLLSISGVHVIEKSEDGSIVSKGFDVVYHISSMKIEGNNVCIKAFVPDDDPKLPSVDSVWGSANWFEREVYDLFGVVFENSRDLRRIMLPPDWVGHPLRKDYVEQNDYKGISTKREDELLNRRVGS